jgi:hypothetical protein
MSKFNFRIISVSSSISSLFGLDLQSALTGGTSTAQNTAALNQFLTSLSMPQSFQQSGNNSLSSASQQYQNNAAALAAVAAMTGGGNQPSSATATSSASLKNMEQQLLLLQQAALLGGVTGSAAFNPYAALLYQNPADLFG